MTDVGEPVHQVPAQGRRTAHCGPVRSRSRRRDEGAISVLVTAASRCGRRDQSAQGEAAAISRAIRVFKRCSEKGSPALFAELGAGMPAELRAAVTEAESAARTVVLAGRGGQAKAAIVVADQLRPGAEAAVARLRRLGLRTVLLTGDNEQAAQAVARQVGIADADVFAAVRPEGKAEVIRRLQDGGRPAAFAGDGVSDAAALAQASLGMAVGAGTDVAIGAADLTLVSGDPAAIADAVQLARAARMVIRANLGWAFGYNVIAIPLAALGYLNPLFAGIAMSASSLIVVANGLRLRRSKATR